MAPYPIWVSRLNTGGFKPYLPYLPALMTCINKYAGKYLAGMTLQVFNI
jgi:hypothetical protein